MVKPMSVRGSDFSKGYERAVFKTKNIVRIYIFTSKYLLKRRDAKL